VIQLLSLRSIPHILVLTLVFIAALAVSSFSLTAVAQNNEVFAGVTFVRANPNFSRPDFRFNRNTDQIGFDAAYTHYFGDSPIGIKADVGASFRGTDSADSSLVTVMAGPTLKARAHRVEPFVHGLIGVGRFAAANQQLSLRFDKSTSGLAYAFGGGLDVKISEHVTIRALQGDYLTTRILDKNVRYLRAATGIVLRF
jgi:opacity protein-like surface antigen